MECDTEAFNAYEHSAIFRCQRNTMDVARNKRGMVFREKVLKHPIEFHHATLQIIPSRETCTITHTIESANPWWEGRYSVEWKMLLLWIFRPRKRMERTMSKLQTVRTYQANLVCSICKHGK